MRALLAILLLAASTGVAAHPLAPALLQLDEAADGTVTLLWRTSVTRAQRNDVKPELPAGCEQRAVTAPALEDEAFVQRWQLHCPGGLAGRSVGVEGLARSGINVIVQVQRPGAEPFSTLLDARTPSLRVPAPAVAPAIFGEYLALGAQHLLGGLDHVLFVAGLVLLVRRARALVLTITAFTLGHSLTLALAALGLVRVDAALMELGIAASILVLACELARGQPSRLSQRPWLMAGGFGLLHGLGFAGALVEAGLPDGQIPLALLAFNLGIELGQLLLVAGLLLLGVLARRLPSPARFAPLAVYGLGALAGFWVIERAAGAFKLV